MIPVGNVGVVIFYTGPKTADVSGEQYRHGELVVNGSRGVWSDPLLPGKYAFNTYAGKIEIIPTVNFILKWVRGEVGAMKLDENLSEISLITKDAFEPTLPLSVVMHIDYKKAPMIIQRFGDVKKLVEQTLDPMVSAFFKNIGAEDDPDRTAAEPRRHPGGIGLRDEGEIRGLFARPSGGADRHAARAQGDHTIENILIQLRSRQIAREQVETYQEQEKAAIQERTLNEAKATAAAQTALTQSLIQVKVNENEGAAALARAQKDAETRKVTAAAVGEQSRLEGQGEADRVLAVGTAIVTVVLLVQHPMLFAEVGPLRPQLAGSTLVGTVARAVPKLAPAIERKRVWPRQREVGAGKCRRPAPCRPRGSGRPSAGASTCLRGR